jgi:hypothetical protein
MAKRVYFAFHYQDVIDFRANVVRNHNIVGGAQKAGYFDHSIWEEAKRDSPLALKRLINNELSGSTVTAVLIGSGTWERPWVRYEIFKSVEKGNRLIGVHINQINGRDGFAKGLGRNPFDYLGLRIDDLGRRATPLVYQNNGWCTYTELSPFNLIQQTPALRGRSITLSEMYPVFDWVSDNGYHNFSNWI